MNNKMYWIDVMLLWFRNIGLKGIPYHTYYRLRSRYIHPEGWSSRGSRCQMTNGWWCVMCWTIVWFVCIWLRTTWTDTRKLLNKPDVKKKVHKIYILARIYPHWAIRIMHSITTYPSLSKWLEVVYVYVVLLERFARRDVEIARNLVCCISRV